MRDLIVLAIILGSVPICLFSPYYGLLLWTWIAYFNPHRFTWGIAYHFPVAETVAIPTLVGTIFSRKLNRNFFTRETFLLLALWVWFAITLLHASQVPLFAGHIPDGVASLERVSKILLMTFFMAILVNTRIKVRYLFMVTAVSIGTLALKGAIFGFRTDGQSRVWGPPESFLADNNDFGLALNLTLPILFYLARSEERRYLRWFLWFLFACSCVCVILTYSRGALLGFGVVICMLAIRGKRKLIGAALLVTCSWLILSFAPQAWMGRMSAFFAGQLDQSAEGRLDAWHFAWNLAQDYPVTGGGFNTFDQQDLAAQYAPGLSILQGPHSIYFQMLGEQGFVGLALFLGLVSCCLLSLRKIRRLARSHPSFHWCLDYTYMIETSLLAFLVSGAFLGRAYFDLSYQLIAGVIILKILLRRELSAFTASEAEPTPVGAEEGVYA